MPIHQNQSVIAYQHIINSAIALKDVESCLGKMLLEGENFIADYVTLKINCE
ncbi:hypothetical protein [Pseudanabaena yagii]|uniref:Uncharacterized protein n=1 Tax=Pseudanabaena yagii GIHE-NHR1 TaxID=2722753 RepID=A0ABX1LU66_9CYAN|nr:hypothetical protein [Pseudanabaena yagii]NMF58828.1 hypothetical protein [Pseudanabaena yagii GIHE-NHR1]